MSNPDADRYFAEVDKWADEVRLLRQIVLGTGLVEAWKWRIPCYTLNNANIVGIYGLKEYAALSFFEGSLLQDKAQMLVRPGENAQFGRLIKYTSTAQIEAHRGLIQFYIDEAIANKRAGKKVVTKRTSDYEVVPEFQERLDAEPDLKAAYEALTPGRQRGYLLHFLGAKQSKTRAARVEKAVPRILAGKGRNDR